MAFLHVPSRFAVPLHIPNDWTRTTPRLTTHLLCLLAELSLVHPTLGSMRRAVPCCCREGRNNVGRDACTPYFLTWLNHDATPLQPDDYLILGFSLPPMPNGNDLMMQLYDPATSYSILHIVYIACGSFHDCMARSLGLSVAEFAERRIAKLSLMQTISSFAPTCALKTSASP